MLSPNQYHILNINFYKKLSFKITDYFSATCSFCYLLL